MLDLKAHKVTNSLAFVLPREARNHPFADGVKRIGLVAGILLLELNDWRFTASEPDATQAVLALALGDMSDDDIAAWLCKNSRRSQSTGTVKFAR